MPNHPSAGLILRCKDGHMEMAEFDLRHLPDGTYGIGADCDFSVYNGGGRMTHYLQPLPDGSARLHTPCVPYGWPTAREAFAALDRYKQQDKERERGSAG